MSDNNTLAGLTDRERQITELICKPLSNKEIARLLNVSEGTIKVHLHRIYEKLAIANRTMLAMKAGASRAPVPPPDYCAERAAEALFPAAAVQPAVPDVGAAAEIASSGATARPHTGAIPLA